MTEGKTRHHSHPHATPEHTSWRSDEALRTVAIATAGMGLVAVVEIVVFIFSHSAGLLADALHNFGDVLTTVALWVAYSLARRPATQRFTYGYHRAEDLAGVLIMLVILLSAITSGITSIERLLHPPHLTNIGIGIGAALFGFVGNEALAEYKLHIGRKLNSAPLIADGIHSRADGITSLAAAAGLLLAALGIPLADPIAGLLISVAILYILLDVGRDVVRRLMDAVDPETLTQIEAVATDVPGVRFVRDVRARWAGRRLYIALTMGADSTLTLADAHAIAEHVRQDVLAQVAGACTVDVHVDPAGLPLGVDPHAEIPHAAEAGHHRHL